ncbi:MAG: Snf7 family protein [Candidatus Odinarchaeia archaeon]
MPIIERLLSWLRGPKLSDLIIKLNLITRKLEMQRRHLEKEAKINRKKAKKQRLEGNTEAAKTYAVHYLQFKKWALNIDAYRLAIEGLINKLRQSEAAADLNKVLGNLKYVLGSIRNRLKVPELNKTMNEIEAKLKDVSVSHDLTATKITTIVNDEAVKDTEVNKVLDEIDQEIAIETEETLPEPSLSVSELEDEIKKLKESGS